MTYYSDPPRWTDSPADAPELLRGGFEAAGREGPSDLQMRALALKLAAVGTGAAVAAGVASAKASGTAAGAGLATTGSSVLTKIAVSVALIGAAATGGTLLLRQPSSTERAAHTVSVAQTQQVAQAEVVQQASAPRTERAVQPENAKTVVSAPMVTQATPAQTTPILAAPVVATLPAVVAHAESKTERRERRHARAESSERTSTEEAIAAPTPSKLAVVNVKGEAQQLSEVDLLSKARTALAARPREAYRLTEEHKAAYPQGMFAQERDALAVEALQRSGDLTHARELAEVFLKHYPSSPAAHRFRETMNLP